MKKEYKIELTVVVGDADRQSLIDVARRCLQPEGVIAIDARTPPSECIETVDDALMALICDHPAFEEAGVEVRELSCTEAESAEFRGGAEIATVPIEGSNAEIASDDRKYQRGVVKKSFNLWPDSRLH